MLISYRPPYLTQEWTTLCCHHHHMRLGNRIHTLRTANHSMIEVGGAKGISQSVRRNEAKVCPRYSTVQLLSNFRNNVLDPGFLDLAFRACNGVANL